MPNFKKYVDPASKFLKDWEWKKLEEIAAKTPKAVPDYVQEGYGNFMNKQLDRAMKGNLSPRDVLKAFGITQSSIGRGGLPYNTATKTGMKLPNTGGEVRPEGAFAEWLGSKPGQQFLDTAEQGIAHPAAMEDLRQKFAPFGKQNQLVQQLEYGVQNAPEWGRTVNQAVTGGVDDYRDWAEGIKGIAGAKSGFVGSMLGRGDLPTFDARQIALHTGNEAPVGIGSIMNRGKGQGAREAVDRLAARQKALGLDIDPSLDPHYQHLTHHAVWDELGGNKTTHEDIVRAMQGYAGGGKIIKAGLDMILPAAENAARTQIAGTVPTYQKAAAMLQDAPGRMIDFGAGLGRGAEAMGQQLGRKVETYEPFAQNWAPDFVRASDVPSEAYGGLTNLNVLNVVPREARDEIVQDIGRVIQPGGTGIITTRGRDVMSAQGRPGPEPMSMITSRDTYQKGFTNQELEDYLRYMLGSNYDINRLKLGPAGVMIRKKAEGGEIQGYSGGKIVKGAFGLIDDILKGTKAATKEGKPLEVYHGGSWPGDQPFKGDAWFTETLDDAKYYADQLGTDVKKANLNVRNPYIMKPGKEETNEVVRTIDRSKYDAVYDPSVGDWIVWDPTRIFHKP